MPWTPNVRRLSGVLLNPQMLRLTRLEQYPDITEDDFIDFAEELVGNQVDIRMLQLAPGAVVTYVKNIEQNASVVGHDLLGDPARRELVEESIRTREFVMAGPLDLIQGGKAAIARPPIVVPLRVSTMSRKSSDIRSRESVPRVLTGNTF